MINIFIMERAGIFSPKTHTPNQCKELGHKHYEYNCKIAFAPNTKLDSNDFLIDHIDVDKTITGCLLKGSCENMHLVIMATLHKALAKRNIKVVGIRMTIIPKYPEGLAQLSYISMESKYRESLACLLN